VNATIFSPPGIFWASLKVPYMTRFWGGKGRAGHGWQQGAMGTSVHTLKWWQQDGDQGGGSSFTCAAQGQLQVSCATYKQRRGVGLKPVHSSMRTAIGEQNIPGNKELTLGGHPTAHLIICIR
jgi:hypothetical protein